MSHAKIYALLVFFDHHEEHEDHEAFKRGLKLFVSSVIFVVKS
jgi:hypothetical protein